VMPTLGCGPHNPFSRLAFLICLTNVDVGKLQNCPKLRHTHVRLYCQENEKTEFTVKKASLRFTERMKVKILTPRIGLICRARKRTAQLFAHPLPYLRARVIIQTAMVGKSSGL